MRCYFISGCLTFLIKLVKSSLGQILLALLTFLILIDLIVLTNFYPTD